MNHFQIKMILGCLLILAVCEILFLNQKRTPSTRIISLSTNNMSASNLEEAHAQKFILKPKFGNGSFVLTKSIFQEWNQPLRKWNPREEILTFMHVGKTAGTYFDKWLAKSGLKEMKLSVVQKHGIKINCHGKIKRASGIFGFQFDFSLVSAVESQGCHTAPITILRHPVKRMVSHFYYAKQNMWTKHLKYVNQNLGEYLHDLPSMMTTHHLWRDGKVSGKLSFLLTM